VTDLTNSKIIDLLVHSRQRIAVPAETIWPHIAALAWMDSPRLVSVQGETGAIGERFEAYDGDVLAFYAVNVELSEGVRRTMRIEDLEGSPLGFVSFELLHIENGTIVMYDVTVRAPLPQGTSGEDVLAGAKAGGEEALLRLKTLLEPR